MNAARKYDILNNQNDDISLSSIKNDPFDLGSAVKGLAIVNHKTTLYEYAEDLVITYAKYSNNQYELSLDMVPHDEQNELVRLYIESIDREIEYACYGDDESINSDYLCALLAMLKDDCEENREKFAEITRKNLLTYYKNSLEELLSVACDNYLNAANNEQGYYASRDMGNGELTWNRA